MTRIIDLTNRTPKSVVAELIQMCADAQATGVIKTASFSPPEGPTVVPFRRVGIHRGQS